MGDGRLHYCHGRDVARGRPLRDGDRRKHHDGESEATGATSVATPKVERSGLSGAREAFRDAPGWKLDTPLTTYAREQAARSADVATVLRPSVVYGSSSDDFVT